MRVDDGPGDEGDRVVRVDGQLAAYGNCTVRKELLKEVTAHPECLDGLDEAGDAGVVGVLPRDLVAVGEDGLQAADGVLGVVGLILGRHGCCGC